jgi:cupin superfamily acireductone dioxygenase involved in methionine salvage
MENLNLPSLKELNISRTNISKMENMKGLPNLYLLEMYETPIEKIEGYRDAPKLIYISTDNHIKVNKKNKFAFEFLKKRDEARYSWDGSGF